METRLSRFCDRLIEAGWLLAVTLVPAFFNVRTARVFEPDKGTILRGLALMMVTAWLVSTIEHAIHRLGLNGRGRVNRPRRHWLFYALAVLAALFAAVYLASTIISVHPYISLMGSYQRGQGTYFTLCLIAISLFIATRLRTIGQVGRLLAAVALGSLPVTCYAVMQSSGIDPLPWGAAGPIVASTLGNPIFLAAYLVMVIPLTLTGLLALAYVTWKELQRFRGATLAWSCILRHSFFLLGGLPILGLQVYTLTLTGARIAPLALLAATVPSALLLIAVPLRQRRGRRVLAGLTGLLILGILLTLSITSFADISLAGWAIMRREEPGMVSAPVVRQLIWQGARELLYTRPDVGAQPDPRAALRPLLGYGPETMLFTYPSVYQPEMGHYEARTASPDRAHNQLLDVGVNLGWAGVAVFLLLLVAFFGAGVMIVLTEQGVVQAIVASGVLWAGLTHFIEAQFSIPIIPTRMLFWVGLGAMAALISQHKTEATKEEPSKVALLLLPTITLVVVTMAGFLRTPRDGVAPGTVMLVGLALAVVTVIVNAVAERRLWTGLLAVLALLLSAGAGLAMKGRLSSLMESPVGSNLHSMDAVLQFTRQTATALPLLSWGAILVGLLSVALLLPRPRTLPAAWNWRSLAAFPLYILTVAGAMMLILGTCVRPVQADIVYKMAFPYDQGRQWELSVELYEEAINLAPRQDFYYIYLGRAQMERAQEESRPARRETYLAQTLETLEHAQALNPLNPDHNANLARFHRAAAEIETALAVQEEHLRAANDYYDQATRIAPQNIILWNEWADLQWYWLHDKAQACRLLEHSLELDPEFEQTQQQHTNICLHTLTDQPQNLDFED